MKPTPILSQYRTPSVRRQSRATKAAYVISGIVAGAVLLLFFMGPA